MPQMPEFKSRRPHGKSRNGCVRCKQQRKKCDESQPSCSRCTAYAYTCKYPEIVCTQKDLAKLKLELLGPDQMKKSLFQRPCVKDGLAERLVPRPQLFGKRDFPMSLPGSFGFLGAAELALFGEYITKTGRLVAFDEDELYVLQVGVPNLALRSRPLMASVLAFAGASKCFQLAQSGSPPAINIREIRRTLELADQHYQIALEEIQTISQFPNCYDTVLANAALMVMYGLTNQSVRIRLARLANEGRVRVPPSILPGNTEWMTLVRTAHMAFVGVLSSPEYVHQEQVPWDQSGGDSKPSFGNPMLNDMSSALSPESGPSEKTRRLILPIVAGTYTSAFNKLHHRVETTKEAMAGEFDDKYYSESSPCLQTDDCLVALKVLEKVVSDMFPGDEKLRVIPLPQDTPSNRFHSTISPWLRTYLARVTSVEPSKPLRRTVMSFLNLVPTSFMSFVQCATNGGAREESDGANEWLHYPSTSRAWDPVEELAAEIFAHWLVLVTLLDGVWWMSSLGEWELERFLSVMDDRGSQLSTKESWWPRSMLTVRKHILR